MRSVGPTKLVCLSEAIEMLEARQIVRSYSISLENTLPRLADR